MRNTFNMGVMLAGDMWVRPVAAVTHGSPATYNSTTGQLNPAAAGVAIAGSRYLTSAGAGEIGAAAADSACGRRVSGGSLHHRSLKGDTAMNYHASFHDAQSALSFMQQQATFIEPQVYETQYPEIQYPDLVPVDTSGNEWVKSKTFYSSDKVGQAQWFHHMANDMPFADIVRTKFEQGSRWRGSVTTTRSKSSAWRGRSPA